jgi:hypothetical protein
MHPDMDACRRHVGQKVSAAVIRERPFAHAIIDDLLPPSMYARLLAELPSQREFVPATFRWPWFGRKRILLPAQANSFWAELYADLLESCLAPAAIAKVAPHLRAGIDASKLTLRECCLVRDTVGYAISPHADAPHKKVISLIYYLTKDDRLRELATCLLQPKSGHVVDDAEYKWHAWKDFDIVDRVEFRPNRLLLLPVTAQSFHAVQRIWKFVQRDSLQAFIA